MSWVAPFVDPGSEKLCSALAVMLLWNEKGAGVKLLANPQSIHCLPSVRAVNQGKFWRPLTSIRPLFVGTRKHGQCFDAIPGGKVNQSRARALQDHRLGKRLVKSSRTSTNALVATGP